MFEGGFRGSFPLLALLGRGIDLFLSSASSEVDLEIDLEAEFLSLHGLGYLPYPCMLFIAFFRGVPNLETLSFMESKSTSKARFVTIRYLDTSTRFDIDLRPLFMTISSPGSGPLVYRDGYGPEGEGLCLPISFGETTSNLWFVGSLSL